jgi:hypothetical protein
VRRRRPRPAVRAAVVLAHRHAGTNSFKPVARDPPAGPPRARPRAGARSQVLRAGTAGTETGRARRTSPPPLCQPPPRPGGHEGTVRSSLGRPLLYLGSVRGRRSRLDTLAASPPGLMRRRGFPLPLAVLLAASALPPARASRHPGYLRTAVSAAGAASSRARGPQASEAALPSGCLGLLAPPISCRRLVYFVQSGA